MSSIAPTYSFVWVFMWMGVDKCKFLGDGSCVAVGLCVVSRLIACWYDVIIILHDVRGKWGFWFYW